MFCLCKRINDNIQYEICSTKFDTVTININCYRHICLHILYRFQYNEKRVLRQRLFHPCVLLYCKTITLLPKPGKHQYLNHQANCVWIFLWCIKDVLPTTWLKLRKTSLVTQCIKWQRCQIVLANALYCKKHVFQSMLINHWKYLLPWHQIILTTPLQFNIIILFDQNEKTTFPVKILIQFETCSYKQYNTVIK